jgi:hypothetical protein
MYSGLEQGALWISAALLFGGTLGYVIAGVRVQWLRSGLTLAAGGCLLLAPFLLPSGSRIGRSAVATVVVLAVHRLWETASNVYPIQAQQSFYNYLCYFLYVPEIQFSATPKHRSLAQREGAWRLIRGLLHALVAGLAFTAIAHWPGLMEDRAASTLWQLVTMYTFCAACCDLLGGSSMLATGHGALEVFHWPFLATSPREFWGRRWNMTFHNACYRLIFSPLVASPFAMRRPWLAASLVFAWSAAVHEYVVVAALGQATFHMTAFFLIQGAATALQSLIRRSKRVKPLPRPWGIFLHTLWMGATSTLFFAPVTQIVQPLQLLQTLPLSLLP